MPRLLRIVGSFLVVVTAYWVYAFTAVPLIEPEEVRANAEPVSNEMIQLANDAAANQRADLRYWFAADDWERTTKSIQILESPQGKLLTKAMTPQADRHFVRLDPCSMVFLPKGQFADENERRRKAIVLRAIEGAILEFDEQVDMKRGQIGQLVGGHLNGPITIHSDQKLPGPDDDLHIVTRDVTLAEDRITTPHLVDFALGPNRGRGRKLRIDLLPDTAQQGAARNSAFGNVTAFDLAQEVYMRLLPGDDDIFPGEKAAGAGKPPPQKPPGERKPAPPVEITCQGPFHFDVARNLATFKNQVDVVRLNPGAQSDQLTSEILDLYFEAEPPAADATPPAPGAEPSSPRLRPARLVAQGNPVVLHAPSKGIHTRSRRLEYNIQKKSGSLTDPREVILQQDAEGGRTQEIHAREVHFESDPNNPQGPPSVFRAVGKGWLRGNRPEDPTQQIEASWSQSLHFAPEGETKLLSLIGKAHVRSPASGAMDADKIFVWLEEVPDSTAVAAEGEKPKTKLQPQKLWAGGHVRLEAQQMTGVVGRMEVWFVHPAPAPAAAGPGTAAPPPKEEEKAPQTTGNQHFHVSGDLLQAEVLMHGEQAQVSRVYLDGHVRCTESRTEKADEEPMIIKGDHLDLYQPQPDETNVNVIGEPASVDARGMHLEGGTIHFRRTAAANRVWIDGRGFLSLPGNRAPGAQPADRNAPPLHVWWQGRMNFDGLTAEFHDDVLARREHATLQTKSLFVTFTEPVRFGAAGSGEQQPEVERILCRNGAFLTNRSFDEKRQLASVEQLQGRDLTLHYRSGDLAVQGPGWVNSWRWEDASARPAKNGSSASPSGKPPAGTATAGKPPTGNRPAQQPAEKRRQLTYLFVRFDRQMTGKFNMRKTGGFDRGKTVFHEQVRAVYGPVARWEQTIDPDRIEALPPRSFVLTCDQLEVDQAPAAGQQKDAVELTATGHTVSEGKGEDGSIFTAYAARLTYAQAKDLVVLEGDPRTAARLYQQPRFNSRPQEVVGEKIFFHPSSEDVDGQNVHSGNVTELSRPKQRK